MIAEEIFRGESDNTEFKEDIPIKSEKYIKTVIAFANGKGGKLVFGVENITWNVTGFDKKEVFSKMDAITNAIFDSCEPKITPNVAVQEIDKKVIIVVEIIPGMQRPYYIKSQGIMNGTYIRVAVTDQQGVINPKNLEQSGTTLQSGELIKYSDKEKNSDTKTKQSGEETLLDPALQILIYIKKKGKCTTAQITELLCIKDRRARKLLSDLVNQNILKKVGKARNTIYIEGDKFPEE